MKRAFAIWLAIGGIAVLAGGVGYASLIEDQRELPDVELATVDRGTIVRTIAATGTLNAVGLVQVGSAVSGRILSLDADFNSVVRQDQIVAQIAPKASPLEWQRRPPSATSPPPASPPPRRNWRGHAPMPRTHGRPAKS